MKIKNLYVGTAGWSYKDWIESFYPGAQSKNLDWLEFYSRYFNIAEVNASYYTYINPAVVEGWIRKVEEKNDFLFSIKLHGDFTHKKNFSNRQIDAVKYNLDMLKDAGRLAGLLIQFPYSFVLDKPNAEHLKNLVEIFSGYEKFIEVRHKSWFVQKFYDFVSGNSSSLCTIDQPAIGESAGFSPVKAGENLYVRMHGRNEKGWRKSLASIGQKQTYEEQSERYDYLYSPGELLEIERALNEVIDTVNKVFVIMNNHPHGNAVANAFELLHLLNERVKLNLPETTLKKYPRLKNISLN